MSGKLEQALFKIAGADAGLSALIGATTNCRFYALLAPQAPQYPFCVYLTVSQQVPNAMGGAGTTDLKRRRVQVDCWGETATASQVLADAVEAAFNREQQTVTVTGGSVEIQDIYLIGRQDIFDFEARRYKTAVDLDIPYVEH